jgi:hypothetical protein
MFVHRNFFNRQVPALAAALLAILASLTGAQEAPQNASPKVPVQKRSRLPDRSSARASRARRCKTTGRDEIIITCDYGTAPRAASNHTRPWQVAINRAVLSFAPNESSNLRVKLTFTNTSATPIAAARTVYIAIDDDAGNNYVRRALPTVDFRKLDPGKPATFSEELRVAKFPPGRYTIALWIPSSDKALQFKSDHNLMIGGAAVADPNSGLNILAKFTVEDRHKISR